MYYSHTSSCELFHKTHPFPVKSRMQGLDADKYRSTMHCATEILKNEGALAFYKGVGPRLTRVCLEVGITMSFYGEILRILDRVSHLFKSYALFYIKKILYFIPGL